MLSVLRDFFFGPGPIAWVQQLFGGGWVDFFRLVTLPGISWGVIVAVGIALLLWGRRAAYSVVGVVVLEAAASTLMNQIFYLDRPAADSIIRYEQLEISSFPSGHVFTATAIWGWLYASRRVSLAVAGSIIALVALARIYLGVHFVGDVVGGFILGCGAVWLFARVWPTTYAWLQQRGAAFYMAVGLGTAALAVATVTLIEPDNPYAWNAVGVMVAGPLALAAERIRFATSPPVGTLAALVVLAIGVVPLLVTWWRYAETSVTLAALTTAVATLWAWAASPLVLSRRRRPASGAST